MSELKHFKKVADYHKFAQLSAPDHPLISLVDYSRVNYPTTGSGLEWQQDYYTIGFKRNVPYKFFYGHQTYDFDEGLMTFVAPQQVMRLGDNPNVDSKEASGWLLLIHPDFLWNSSLAEQIGRYDFFGYAVREALFLSTKEEEQMMGLFSNIQREIQANIDPYSQKIIVAQIELLLRYAERFYARQFITREINNHRVLEQLEATLSVAFQADQLAETGVPSVKQVANELNFSPNYLSALLKSLTGLSTQQHIQNKIIEVAKKQLSSGEASISEIAYGLGFEHPASFSKLFKNKTKSSPAEFRSLYQ